MSRSSISARLASIGGATLLIAGLFTQAAPALAAGGGPRMSSAARGSGPEPIHRGATTSVKFSALAGSSRPSCPSTRRRSARSSSRSSLPAAPRHPAAKPIGAAGPRSRDGVGQARRDEARGRRGTDRRRSGHVHRSGFRSRGRTRRGRPNGQYVAEHLRSCREQPRRRSHEDIGAFFSLTETSGPSGHTTFDAEPRVMFDTVRQRWIVIRAELGLLDLQGQSGRRPPAIRPRVPRLRDLGHG